MNQPAPEQRATLFDSHAHLTFRDFRDDFDAVLERAREAGLVGVVTVGSGGGARAFSDAIGLAQQHDWIWATAGLHPHDAKYWSPELKEELERAGRDAQVVAIGEAGLDYHYDNSPRDQQRDVFREQLSLARELCKPIVVHTRSADEDTIAIVDEIGLGDAGGVIHCFSGGPEFAEAMLARGFYLSFSGIVTFPKAEDVRAAALLAPDDRIMVETDSPFLAPKPHRGRRNEPAHVAKTAEKIAEIRGVSLADIARITTRNTRRFYDLETQELAPIVYPIRDQLYLNVTNQCTLACTFCPKRRDWTVKGHYLGHEKEPSAQAVRQALWAASPVGFREVVFCGLGESTHRLELVLELGRELRRRGISTRLDTDGLASLRVGRDVVPELATAFDAMSVSLNAGDDETYARLCPSKYGREAWHAVVAFIGSAREHVSDVTASVVTVPGLEVEPIRRFVEDDLGVRFRAREYNVVG